MRAALERSGGKASLCALALGIACSRTDAALAAERAREDAREAQEAREAQIGRAEAIAASAFEAYRREQYAKAIALYLDAYAVYPAADILFNIARIYDLCSSDPAQARRFYQAYIDDPEADVHRIAIASERLEPVEPDAAPPREPAVASASASVGSTPSPPPRQAATAALEPRISPSTEPVVLGIAATDRGSWSPATRAALVAGGAGLAAIGVGVGFGVAALSEAATARRNCNGNRCESLRGIQAVRSAARSADIATLGFGVGGALLAGGLVLLALPSDDREAEATEADLELRPVARRSRLGLELTGTW